MTRDPQTLRILAEQIAAAAAAVAVLRREIAATKRRLAEHERACHRRG